MERLGYYNGAFGPLEDMMVPMNDRVSWFGDGVYDAGPCRNYHIFALDEHVDRFFRSAATLQIRMPVGKEELKHLGYENPTDEQGKAFIHNKINFAYEDKGERSPAFDYKRFIPFLQ